MAKQLFYMGDNGQPVPFGSPKPVTNVFEQNNKISEVAEEMQWNWYDRFTLAAATLEHLLFQTPKGQAGKTLADTNMVQAGVIPKGKSFITMAFNIQYQNNSALTAAKVLALGQMFTETTFQFKMDSKETFWTQNLGKLMGFSLFGVETAANNFAALSKIPGVYPLNIPIRLSEQDAFEVRIVHHTAPDAALNGDKLQIGLDGVQFRNT